MKYYAVTDDPRELYHYGVKGMKWGQHIFGDKPKSPGYHKAVSKLKGIMGKTAKAAKSTAAQVSYNHRQRQDRKFEKAIQKSQQRIAQIEGLHMVDQAQKYERQLNKDQNRVSKQQTFAKKAYKAEKKRELNYAKSEAKMDKYLQQAREGKLKYGQLSEDQIHRIQNRLQLESNTRRLESAEKTWRQQKKEARRAGYLSGITKGTAAAMEEVARAGATYGIQHLMDRKKLKSAAKLEGKEDKIKNKEKNKKTHADIRKDIKTDLYKAEQFTNSREGKRLQELRNAEEQHKFEQQQKQYALQSARQQKEQEEQRERKLEKDAEMAYLYGYVPNASGGGKGNGNQQGKANNSTTDLANYYKKRYIDKETDPEKAEREAREEFEKQQREARAELARRRANGGNRVVTAKERKKEEADRLREMAYDNIINARKMQDMQRRINNSRPSFKTQNLGSLFKG